jgi:hypothetical protein
MAKREGYSRLDGKKVGVFRVGWQKGRGILSYDNEMIMIIIVIITTLE